MGGTNLGMLIAGGHHGVQGGLKRAEVVAIGVWGLVILGSEIWYFEE